MPSSPLPPPLEPNFDLAAYRQFMCAETQLYREDYIRDRVQLQGQEHYQAALQKGSVVVVFVHHGSWLLMNGALHHLCGGAPITSIASRRNLEFVSIHGPNHLFANWPRQIGAAHGCAGGACCH
ncbi:MAG: hypothetical protein LW705_09990 [Comamonadaceae bacterium]|nr:hypothetical protein [Comamonadaceae bacterium]